jgi:hypothetical protein
MIKAEFETYMNKKRKWSCFRVALCVTDLLHICNTVLSTKKQQHWSVVLYLHLTSMRDRNMSYNILQKIERWGDVRWELVDKTKDLHKSGCTPLL